MLAGPSEGLVQTKVGTVDCFRLFHMTLLHQQGTFEAEHCEKGGRGIASSQRNAVGKAFLQEELFTENHPCSIENR